MMEWRGVMIMKEVVLRTSRDRVMVIRGMTRCGMK